MYVHKQAQIHERIWLRWHGTQPELKNTASWVFLFFTVVSNIDTLWTWECSDLSPQGCSCSEDSGNKGLIPVPKSWSKITCTVQICRQWLIYLTNFPQIQRLYSLMQMSKNLSRHVLISFWITRSSSFSWSFLFVTRYICNPDTFPTLFIFLSTK